MTVSRSVVVQYCDDVRQEVGNKISLMGCYGSNLVIDGFPALLQKLCAQIRIQTPKDQPFSKLSIRAKLNDEIISEIQLDSEQLSKTQAKLKIPDDSLGMAITVFMTFTPIEIPEPGKLKIRVETEDGVLVGNSLRLQLSEAVKSVSEES